MSAATQAVRNEADRIAAHTSRPAPKETDMTSNQTSDKTPGTASIAVPGAGAETAAEGRRWAERIRKLDSGAKARWGKMTVAEMSVHCRMQLEATWSGPEPKVGFFARTFMKFMVLSGPWPKGRTPTYPPWDMSTNGIKPGNFADDVEALASAAERFFSGGYKRNPSPVVGPLSDEQWMHLQRRHLNHHLEQFGA